MINPLRDNIRSQNKQQKEPTHTPEPIQIPFISLARHPNVHTPHTSDDVEWQDHGTEDGQFAEDIARLFCALVHGDVELGEVVGVGAGEDAVMVC